MFNPHLFQSYIIFHQNAVQTLHVCILHQENFLERVQTLPSEYSLFAATTTALNATTFNMLSNKATHKFTCENVVCSFYGSTVF